MSYGSINKTLDEYGKILIVNCFCDNLSKGGIILAPGKSYYGAYSSFSFASTGKYFSFSYSLSGSFYISWVILG